MLEPACLGVLLFLTSVPAGDQRLLGAPSRFGRGVGLSAIAGSIAFAIKSVTDSAPEESWFWNFVALTAAPCAAGCLLLGASRTADVAAQRFLGLTALVGGLLSATGGLAYGVKLAAESPLLDFWVFAFIAIVPFGLGCLAVVASQDGARGLPGQCAGLGIAALAVALTLKVISLSPLEAFLFNILGISRLFGWEMINFSAAGGEDLWLILANAVVPAALGLLVFFAAQDQ
jgi:hypothetical protein